MTVDSVRNSVENMFPRLSRRFFSVVTTALGFSNRILAKKVEVDNHHFHSLRFQYSVRKVD